MVGPDRTVPLKGGTCPSDVPVVCPTCPTLSDVLRNPYKHWLSETAGPLSDLSGVVSVRVRVYVGQAALSDINYQFRL